MVEYFTIYAYSLTYYIRLLYRVFHQLADLVGVDLNLGCSTLLPNVQELMEQPVLFVSKILQGRDANGGAKFSRSLIEYFAPQSITKSFQQADMTRAVSIAQNQEL